MHGYLSRIVQFVRVNLLMIRYNICLLVRITVSLVLMACASHAVADRIELCDQSVPDKTPELTSLPTSIRFKGTISRHRIFEREIIHNLIFRLNPYGEDWEIWIGDKSPTGHNFCSVVTPPYHGINARFIEGWHFRNNDNSASNEPGRKNVNAPQEERNFCFVLNEADYQTAYGWLNEALLPSEKVHRQVMSRYKSLKLQKGVLRITQLDLGNLVMGQQPWIEHMEFEVEIFLLAESSF